MSSTCCRSLSRTCPNGLARKARNFASSTRRGLLSRASNSSRTGKPSLPSTAANHRPRRGAKPKPWQSASSKTWPQTVSSLCDGLRACDANTVDHHQPPKYKANILSQITIKMRQIRSTRAIVEPDHGGEHGFLRTYKAVAAVQHHDGTVGGIAGGVVIEHVPHRAPAADVRPPQIGRNHGGELGTLHDGVIDRFFGRACERFACQPQKIEVAREAGNRRLGGLGHRRLEALDLAEHGRGVKQ